MVRFASGVNDVQLSGIQTEGARHIVDQARTPKVEMSIGRIVEPKQT
jgi:hypothetical protein